MFQDITKRIQNKIDAHSASAMDRQLAPGCEVPPAASQMVQTSSASPSSSTVLGQTPKHSKSRRDSISVVVRVRPPIPEDANSKELLCDPNIGDSCIEVRPTCEAGVVSTGECLDSLVLSRPFYDSRIFRFPRILSPSSSQAETFDAVAQPVLHSFLSGFNGTIMCYGQTGSGKTFTAFGPAASWSDSEECGGIVPRAVRHVFNHIGDKSAENPGFRAQVHISFMQLYLEELSDLLANSTPDVQQHVRGTAKKPRKTKRLCIREGTKGQIYVEGLSKLPVQCYSDVMEAIKRGVDVRATAQTRQNMSSSRSHALIQLHLEQWDANAPGTCGDAIASIKSTLTIVDLAGSERVSKSGSEGLRLEEAKRINKSVAALGNCISALAEKAEQAKTSMKKKSRSRRSKIHVPFRDSLLTRLLTDSLGGNTCTCLCANVCPSPAHYEETFSTLLLARRAAKVRNVVHINRVRRMRVSTPVAAAAAPLPSLQLSQSRDCSNGENVRTGTVSSPSHASVLRRAAKTPFQMSGPLTAPVLLAGTDAHSHTQSPLGTHDWARREAELVSKFTSVIHSLQMELAQERSQVAKLRQEVRRGPDGNTSTAGGSSSAGEPPNIEHRPHGEELMTLTFRRTPAEPSWQVLR